MEYKSKRVPEEYRIQHYAASKSIGINNKFGNAERVYYNTWESFNGDVCVTISPADDLIGLTPLVRLYINDVLTATRTISNKAISGCELYETSFSGLENGDSYELRVSFLGGDGQIYSLGGTRTYRGKKGNAPSVSQTSSRITSSMSSPFNKDYSIP